MKCFTPLKAPSELAKRVRGQKKKGKQEPGQDVETGFLPEETCQSQATLSLAFQGLEESMKGETEPLPVKMENLTDSLLSGWATSPGQEWASNQLVE